MRPASLRPVSLALLLLVPACSDDGTGSTGLSAGTNTTSPATGATGTTAAPTTGGSTGTTDDTGSTGTTSSSTTAPLTTSTTGSTTADTSSTTMDPNCPPVKGGYYDCTDEQGKTDNTMCMWMGDGENGFITCLSAGGMPGASTCSLVNCDLDCHCFNPPETGTAKSICKLMATAMGDNACVLDCSNGATCPDGMVCDNDVCFWPAP